MCFLIYGKILIKLTLLTALCSLHPISDLDPSRLTFFCISLQDFAKEVSVASSHAYIIFTVLKVHVRVDYTMTFTEWTLFCDDPTVAVPSPLVRMFAFTTGTPTYTVISALGITYHPWHLPAASKSCNPTCLGASRCGEIII